MPLQLPKNVHSALCKHIVGISWVDAKTDPDGSGSSVSDYSPESGCLTAFALRVSDFWFLATAGHVLAGINKRLSLGRRRIRSQVIGGFASGARILSSPFELDKAHVQYEDANGADYGFILLHAFHVRGLIADGVEPLRQLHWTNIPDSMDQKIQHALLGLPDQAQEVRMTEHNGGGRINLNIRIPSIPVYPAACPPEVSVDNGKRFCAQVPVAKGRFDDKSISVTDIAGMSGGPIFAVRRRQDNSFQYWIRAIQSSWI